MVWAEKQKWGVKWVQFGSEYLSFHLSTTYPPPNTHIYFRFEHYIQVLPSPHPICDRLDYSSKYIDFVKKKFKSSLYPPHLLGRNVLLHLYTGLGHVTWLANRMMAHRTHTEMWNVPVHLGSLPPPWEEYSWDSPLVPATGCICQGQPRLAHPQTLEGVQSKSMGHPTVTRTRRAPDDLRHTEEPSQDQQSHPATISWPSAKPPDACTT